MKSAGVSPKKISKLNILIPELIEQSKKLNEELKNRIKLNQIFQEFEDKASNKLTFLIRESEKRHSGSKSGKKLEYLYSEERLKNEAKKILDDYFYKNIDIPIEREKMKKKPTLEIHNKIREITLRLKGIRNLNILSPSVMPNMRNKINFLNSKQQSNKSGSTCFDEQEKKIKKGKEDIVKFLGNDEMLLENSFSSYKNSINNLKYNSVDNINTLDYENKDKLKKLRFNLPNIGLLNYKKKVISIKTQKEEDEENKVNIQKLLPYSKSGVNLFLTKIFLQKEKLKKNNDSNNKILNRYKNSTSNIVLNSAKREFAEQKYIFVKNNAIENILRVNDIPKLNKYETIIKDNFQKIKDKRHKLNEIVYKGQKLNELTFKKRVNCIINSKIERLNNFERQEFGNHTKTVSIWIKKIEWTIAIDLLPIIGFYVSSPFYKFELLYRLIYKIDIFNL